MTESRRWLFEVLALIVLAFGLVWGSLIWLDRREKAVERRAAVRAIQDDRRIRDSIYWARRRDFEFNVRLKLDSVHAEIDSVADSTYARKFGEAASRIRAEFERRFGKD